MVERIYVEKKKAHAVEARGLLRELMDFLGIKGLDGVRIVQRYDVEGMTSANFARCVPVVFSEPPLDDTFTELPAGDFVLAVEYQPGQFDQRAESAAECIQLFCGGERPTVRSARLYIFDGDLRAADKAAIEGYLINPVEARRASLESRATLLEPQPAPDPVAVLDGFRELLNTEIPEWIAAQGLAMEAADLMVCRDYFREENRDPTLTELRVLDTYWSDHCRHTTFLTELQDIEILDDAVGESYQLYLDLRRELGRESKPITLMDIATIGARALHSRGLLPQLDKSDEINACSVRVTVDNDGADEDWLLLFKNETHNHPTEIEPFGGAATCLGGAIRDPLSGRAYVYQAMRVTGAGNPLSTIAETLSGKLPQRKLVTTAAHGYASYGNQIGLATGQVAEIYHPGYTAKRMEIGAVVGAVPAANVRREEPVPGDIVLLVGGRTGRDGCGGATGSSKAHSTNSLAACGAEVQKGNPPTERKLQRLFRDPEAARKIKRCNDFGAGGVAVAVGELAEGLRINLDAVPKKYDGLDGTELAISESQERMAVVVDAADADGFIRLAEAENLEATPVAVVTAEKRLQMLWNGVLIVDIARAFLDTNGASRTARASVAKLPVPAGRQAQGIDWIERLVKLAGDINIAAQTGLVERFDSTIGAATVLMPFGGARRKTPPQAMVAKLPVVGETATVSGMAFGFDPFLSEQNPHDGGYLAIVESVAKLIATGFCRVDITLSLQEYFERLRDDAARWGKPLAALLGALRAQIDLGVGAIGGKDSMSGSFEALDVPPTLLSFAVAPGRLERVISPEFKKAGSRVVWLCPAAYRGIAPQGAALCKTLNTLERLITEGQILAAWAVGNGGAAEGLLKMSLGNGIGVRLHDGLTVDDVFAPRYGSFILELAAEADSDIGMPLGITTAEYELSMNGQTVDIAELERISDGVLEPVFPSQLPVTFENIPTILFETDKARRVTVHAKTAQPRALIPVFPGTNCEYDTARALRRAGAQPEIFVIRNLTPAMVAESVAALARRIGESQMIVLPGGFSGGDEPEGSAKLINAFFRSGPVAEAMSALLEQRDGLMLGICNGFQALIKLGLVPFGHLADATADSPTLTFNIIGRHQSKLIRTRVCSNLSPWLMHEPVGSIHNIAISHGEGRFVCPPELLDQLLKNGQVATQYVDENGNPSNDLRYNPNGSLLAIEAIASPDGRILGKMGHSERSGNGLYKNVPGNNYQRLFEGGVDYFKL